MTQLRHLIDQKSYGALMGLHRKERAVARKEAERLAEVARKKALAAKFAAVHHAVPTEDREDAAA
jgi:hypothetical protein